MNQRLPQHLQISCLQLQTSPMPSGHSLQRHRHAAVESWDSLSAFVLHRQFLCLCTLFLLTFYNTTYHRNQSKQAVIGCTELPSHLIMKGCYSGASGFTDIDTSTAWLFNSPALYSRQHTLIPQTSTCQLLACLPSGFTDMSQCDCTVYVGGCARWRHLDVSQATCT